MDKGKLLLILLLFGFFFTTYGNNYGYYGYPSGYYYPSYSVNTFVTMPTYYPPYYPAPSYVSTYYSWQAPAFGYNRIGFSFVDP